MPRILIRTAALCAVLAGALASAAAAQGLETFDGIAGVKEVDTDNSVEMNGVSVTARGRIGGDLELNAATADGEAQVGGDLEMNAASAEFSGRVTGDALVNAAGATLDGEFLGSTEVNAGRATLRGRYAGPVTMNGGRAEFEGAFASPVTFTGDGEGGLFRRGDRSHVVLAGEFASGGSICAHQVVVSAGASFGEPLTVRADAPPRFEDGADQDGIIYEERTEGRCD